MSPAADRIASGTIWMAKLLAEKPDALMRARPGLYELWEGNDPGPPRKNHGSCKRCDSPLHVTRFVQC